MKEQLYTIPVNDAFNTNCECPICAMRKTLEDNALDFTMGPSYMEDDIRAVTDKLGFCREHMTKLKKTTNRLGLALILKTHMDKTINDIEKASKKTPKVKGNMLKKTIEQNPLADYINTLNSTCFVCNQIENTFDRYLNTVLYLYKTDAEFKQTFKSSKGFCLTHYEQLYTKAYTTYKDNLLEDFITTLNAIFIENMKRVRDDLDWFITKFDYRYTNEPWKNSKDALPRSITKLNSIYEEE